MINNNLNYNRFYSKYFNEIYISDDLFINNINSIKLQYIDYDNINK